MFFTSANRANSVVSDWLLLLLLLLPAADVSGNINDAAQRATNYRPTLSVCSMHRSTTAKNVHTSQLLLQRNISFNLRITNLPLFENRKSFTSICITVSLELTFSDSFAIAIAS